ncbi:MAG: FHA domain-containing protein [Deltaproteobacteria bacterium]|nr:FHA domain-containing protein [Deltaproteobacteria bacterium]
MNKKDEKTIRTDRHYLDKAKAVDSGFSRTLEISRDTFIGEITSKQHAYLEVLDEKNTRFELGEAEAIIGRTPECDIQLPAGNVSRTHARITFRNEEYQIEDLESTNGIYVNGIKIEKCILRNHDLLDIGGVKILFNEEKIRQEP